MLKTQKVLQLINANIALILENFSKKKFEVEFKFFHFYLSLNLIQKLLFHFLFNFFLINFLYLFFDFNWTFFSYCDNSDKKKELEEIFCNGQKIFSRIDNIIDDYDSWYDDKGRLKFPVISRLVSVKEPFASETLFYFYQGKERHLVENVHNSVYYKDGSMYSTLSNTDNFLPYAEFKKLDYDCNKDITEHIKQRPTAFHSFKISRDEKGVSRLEITPRYYELTSKIYKTVKGGVKKWKINSLPVLKILEKK